MSAVVVFNISNSLCETIIPSYCICGKKRKKRKQNHHPAEKSLCASFKLWFRFIPFQTHIIYQRTLKGFNKWVNDPYLINKGHSWWNLLVFMIPVLSSFIDLWCEHHHKQELQTVKCGGGAQTQVQPSSTQGWYTENRFIMGIPALCFQSDKIGNLGSVFPSVLSYAVE